MNVGFLVPLAGIIKYAEVYRTIVSIIEKKGHTVVHPLAVSDALVTKWSQQKSESYLNSYYSRVNKSDIIIAECTLPCINIGLEIANALQQGKEITILKALNPDKPHRAIDPLYNRKNIFIYEYLSHNLKETVEAAIAYNPGQKFQKFNMLFTPEMLAKLTITAKKKQLPKSVYIRQLLEKCLDEDQ